MYSENEMLPLSGLQHLMFCPRQWGLIHLEAIWEENHLTAEGRIVHERADHGPDEWRGETHTVHALRISSRTLGLSGIADVVEFNHADGQPDSPVTQIVPVEYKRGRKKHGHEDVVQLCAQALCLEEMLGIHIAYGAMFYHQTRRHLEVPLNETLRTETIALATRMHQLYELGTTPPPVFGKHCNSCSLKERCMPEALQKPKSVARYIGSLTRTNQPLDEELPP